MIIMAALSAFGSMQHPQHVMSREALPIFRHRSCPNSSKTPRCKQPARYSLRVLRIHHVSCAVDAMLPTFRKPRQPSKRCVQVCFYLYSDLDCQIRSSTPITDAGSFGITRDVSKTHESNPLDETSSQMSSVSQYLVCSRLQKCIANKDIVAGRQVHSFIVDNKLESVNILGDHLIRLFTACGTLQEAVEVFYNIANPSIYTWHAIILAHAVHDENSRALELYFKMQEDGIMPNTYVFSSALKVCGCLGEGGRGRLIHGQVIQSGLELDVVVGSALVDMYGKCGSQWEARTAFQKLPIRNVLSWNTIIAGYAQHGDVASTLELFKEMQREGLVPNKSTFVCMLKLCDIVDTIEQGRLIHDQVVRHGLETDTTLGNILINMYTRCGSLEEAQRVFLNLKRRDVLSWGTIIAGYVRDGHYLNALELFMRMQAEGLQPNKVAFLCSLQACARTGATAQGKLIHDQIIKTGLEVDVAVGNTLVDMYAKCGNLKEAHKVFDNLASQTVVSWNVIIAGYVEQEHALLALQLFDKMQQEGLRPSCVTFLCTLKACGSIGALGQGKLLHDQIIRSGLEAELEVGNALVDMYSKCDGMEEAHRVFDKLSEKNVVSWGTLVSGYAQYGECSLVRQCLEDMQQRGLKLNPTVYTSVLTACSLAGHVDEGKLYFKGMRELDNISPGVQHFNCMVRLLARSGQVNEAQELLESMPVPPDSTGWLSLLSTCRTYGNVKVGRQCFDRLLQLDPNIAAGYVLMSNIYAEACMWEDAKKIQQLKKSAGVWKKPGKAWIEVDNTVHEFMVGDRTHPLSDTLYAKLESLRKPLEEEGYLPQSGLVHELMSERPKEDALCEHSEKLAIAFGILSMPEGTTIRVRKNLRVCNDCHNVSKIISKVEKRQIVLRDTHRFHRFEDGSCSCGDYF